MAVEGADRISLVVESEKRKGRNGDYTVKVVKHNGKSWTVGKKGQDKVEVGGTYPFKLEKSEYNDQIYYWANLIEDETEKPDKKPEQKPEQPSSAITNTQFVAYFKSLDKEKKITALKYLLDQME